MQKIFILQKDYTLFNGYYQLVLPLDLEYRIPADDSVRLLSQFIEGMHLGDLYRTYRRQGRGNELTPRQMLKIMSYSYMNNIYSSREIETACRRDINFMWLLEGKPAPDHATLARFRSLHLAACEERIMAEISEFLYQLGELSGKTLFVDGTKIEACANKYTFVWKKSVTKNQEKLLIKMADFIQECETLYGIKQFHGSQVKMKHVKKLHKKLYALMEAEGISFVHGPGKRKPQLQKSIETLEEYMDKLKEYTKKLCLCGDRGSYSKTDPDATFLRMKEDTMGTGQLKAGYNVQHGVDSEYIVWFSVSHQATDTTTLIPFLKEMKEFLSFRHKKIVTDAGYESEENYGYLKENDQLSFVKPVNYERSKTRKYQRDISRMENMEYDSGTDSYICHNGKRLTVSEVKKSKTKTGYEREITMYLCRECEDCPHKKDCIKEHQSKKPLEERSKALYVSKKFLEYRKEGLERIVSEEGKELRINRSIQVEGSFGELKQNSRFRRFLCRGKENVKAEMLLHALAHNIKKLHKKIQGNRTGSYLFPMKKGA